MNSKDRFLKMPEAKLFADMVSSEACKKALDYAMLEMQERMQFDDLKGALAFRRTLENLIMPEEPPKQDKSPTINYDAYNRPQRPRSAQ